MNDEAFAAGAKHGSKTEAMPGFKQNQREAWCIALKVPASGDKDLDELILESRRLDIVTSIASQLAANVSTNSSTHDKCPTTANRLIKMAEREVKMNHLD